MVLEEMNLYNPKSGITQNMSEGFNTVMRRMNEWNEASIDICVLTVLPLVGPIVVITPY